jgi:molybdopterin/thiamine biosynthesis adenylyltransferase/rhodanese-related sulfurtransferase
MSLPPLVEPAAELTAEEIARYSRHVILPDVGMTGQRRLKAARVAVVGAGGLGSPALLYLAAAGVGTLGVIDDDLVDASNLQRQVIHGQADLGRPKVDSAADRIGQVNPLVTVNRYGVRLDSTNALDVLRGYHLVLDGTDTFPARYLIGDACELLGLPEVWGSIYRFDGQVSVFWSATDPPGPVYRDLFPQPPPPGSVPSCAEGGVLGVLCAAIGSMMATEAIKLICGIGEPLLGRLMVLDALETTWRTVRVRPDPSREPVRELIDYEQWCAAPSGGSAAEPSSVAGERATIDVYALAAMLAERERGERAFTLIDVRELHERDIVAIPGSVLVPLAQVLDGGWPAGAAGEPVVLYCKSGVRSARALAALHAAGRTDAVHVAGGVLAWVEQIEPHLPVY